MSSETKNLFKKDSFSDPRMLWTNIEKDSRLYSEISEVLKKSFHQILNSNFSQMFSFIKILDICNDTISFTFYGNP